MECAITFEVHLNRETMYIKPQNYTHSCSENTREFIGDENEKWDFRQFHTYWLP